MPKLRVWLSFTLSYLFLNVNVYGALIPVEASFDTFPTINSNQQIDSFSGFFRGEFDEVFLAVDEPITIPVVLTFLELSPSFIGETVFDLTNVDAEILYPGDESAQGSPYSIVLYGSISGTSVTSTNDDFIVNISSLAEAPVTPFVSVGSIEGLDTFNGIGTVSNIIPEPSTALIASVCLLHSLMGRLYRRGIQ